jgi:hypothetical protein
MENTGQIQNGAIIPDQPLQYPNGTRVNFEVHQVTSTQCQRLRQYGQLRGRIKIASDFDVLPDNIATAFGVSSE